MKNTNIETDTTSNTTAAITRASSLLKAGGIVAFPTETVYGLGADANNESACRRIFAVKGRPASNPLIVHIASLDSLPLYACEIPPLAIKLAQTFWPGPLTLILKKQSHVLDIVTAGQDTIALRVPNHPIAQSLLQAFGSGIAAPSANKFTYISGTHAEAVQNELGKEVDYIIDGGDTPLGLESTIIDLSREIPRILRPGMISADLLSQFDPSILVTKTSTTRAPGMYAIHYAPKTKTMLARKEEITNLLQNLHSDHSKETLALMTHTMNENDFLNQHSHIHIVIMPNNPAAYAHKLYRELRKLDHLNYQRIIVESVPDEPAWDAINDRLLKATSLR